MQEKRPSLIKLINNLYRYTQSYTDNALEKFQLSSGTYPYLLILYENEGISQNQISKKLNLDKAMSARAIKRLIELGYLRKDIDIDDSRAYKLFLTDNAKIIIPEIISEVHKWIYLITKDSNTEQQEFVIDFLSKALVNAKAYKINSEEGPVNTWKE